VLGIGVPQATAIADAAGARIRYLEETGRYVHVIADGGMRTGGDVAKAIACGADAVMIGSPLRRGQESMPKALIALLATWWLKILLAVFSSLVYEILVSESTR
jgi:IMP dehydrogenase